MRVACFLIFLAVAAPAAPQSKGKVAIGGAIGTRLAPRATVGGDPIGVGLIWRLGHGKEGVGWEWGLNWFASNVDHSISGTPAFTLGELHIRPVMAGDGYTHPLRPTAL